MDKEQMNENQNDVEGNEEINNNKGKVVDPWSAILFGRRSHRRRNIQNENQEKNEND
ncbi:hypothetical protein [Cerasibacillus terrae]|uniref:hypothetical protein n=1 Tax=Cerasibacillus terrae TaxID=2498845 RepID=UPI001746FA51|nr:hypothetical protein [Cerasibacillus terrae]